MERGRDSDDVTPRRRRYRRPFPVVATIAIVACTLLFVWPVLMIVIGAFRSAPPGLDARWTLDPLVSAYTDVLTYRTLGNSLAIAVSVTLLAKGLGLYLAWLVARTDTPLRRLVTPVMVLVLAMPPLFFAISWGLLGNEQVGLLNQLLQAATGTEWTPVNTESWAGLIFVAALKSASMGFLLLIGPFLAMDRAQEEAALTSGAGKLRTFLTINLPALAPAVLGVLVLGVVIGLEYFDLPLVLGTPAGIHVFSTEIYSYLNNFSPPRYPEASSLAIALVIILLALLTVQGKLLGGRDFVTVGGKGSRREPWRLGRWRYLGTVVIVLYTVAALVLPMIQLILVSLAPFFGVYSTLTPLNYLEVLNDPSAMESLRTTAVLAALGGLLCVTLAVLIAYVMRHQSGRWTRYLRVSTWLPWSIPGTALALGMLWAYLSVPVVSSLYGTAAFLLIGLIVAATPIAMRTVEPAVSQVSMDLEEAAWVAGGRRGRSFVVVVVRLALPSLLAGWLLSGILIAGNLAIPLMMGSVGTETVPALVYERYVAGRVPESAALLCLVLAGIAVGAVVIMALTWGLRALLSTMAARSAASPTNPESRTEGART